MRDEPIIPHDHAARLIEDALRLRVGRGKRYSFDQLADATRIKRRTLESYVQGATPGLGALLTLCSVLGPSFTSDLLAPCGQSAKEGSSDEAQHMQVLSALCGLSNQIAEALEDDHVDHQEKAAIRPVAADLIEKLQPLARDANVEPLKRGDAA